MKAITIHLETCIECDKPFDQDLYTVHCNECGRKKENHILTQYE